MLAYRILGAHHRCLSQSLKRSTKLGFVSFVTAEDRCVLILKSDIIIKPKENKMIKIAGFAGAAAFMILVSVVQQGQKSIFKTPRTEEEWVKAVEEEVKARNKASKITIKRADR